MPTAPLDLPAVFSALRQILATHSSGLLVQRDDDDQLYVDTHHLQPNGKPLFFGAVQRKKGSVAFHLMPVYQRPDLLASISPALKARMQGQSCFHFKTVDPALFDELDRLTQAGLASYREQGLV
jgi:hypothetical protein